MKVYITYESYGGGGEKIDPGDHWSSRNHTIIEYNLKYACLVKPESWYFEERELDCEEPPRDVYVVLVRYSDGDTFGSSTGNGYIEGVYANKSQAMKVVESIRNDTYIGKGKRGYVLWKGFFNELELVRCYVMKLRKKPNGSNEPIRIID